jgi:transposase-like protein
MKSALAVEPLEIAKHDEQGRRIADLGEKQTLIAAYESSGMTQRAFARREGINYFTFATWLRKKRLDAAKASPSAPQRFLELRLPGAVAPSFAFEVVFPDGVIVRGSQAKEVAAIARALR